ncbi:hypothetical protein F5Y13DRAFT_198982 [Hypoxylon sp. FL1857]|nr:hypothetical protein F5Y13DRAFT_198982 [Hypoxylon sp. FL1857]
MGLCDVSHKFMGMDSRSPCQIHSKTIELKAPHKGRAHAGHMFKLQLKPAIFWPYHDKVGRAEIRIRRISTKAGRDNRNCLAERVYTDSLGTEDNCTLSTVPSPSTDTLEGLGYMTFAQSFVNSFWTRKKNWLISRASAYSSTVSSGDHIDEGSSCYQRSAAGFSESPEGLIQTQSHHTWRSRRYNDDENGQQRPNKKQKISEAGGAKKLLACPYHQREPFQSCKHRSCCGPGWTSISRLKEHLYRTHFSFRCRRCKSKFESSSELENHYQHPTPCMVSSITPDPVEGFNESQRERLKCRSLQDWKQIYQILFPDDDEASIPSQHYSTVTAIADVFERFDRDYQLEVDRQLPGRLGHILAGHHLRANSVIVGDILAVVSDIHSRVIQSFRQRTNSVTLDSSNQPSRSTTSAISASRMELNLDSPSSYFAGYVDSLGVEDESTQNTGADSTNYFSNTGFTGDDLEYGLLLPEGRPPFGIRGGELNNNL